MENGSGQGGRTLRIGFSTSPDGNIAAAKSDRHLARCRVYAMSARGECKEIVMAHEMQADLVKEIAGLVGEYRKDSADFVKFGLKCGIALNKLPIAAGIMHSPKHKEERYQIGDPAFRGKFPVDKDAFYAAFDQFVGNAQFLAWDGHAPDAGNIDMVKGLSENYARPTMMLEIIYRKRGRPEEKKLRMFFIGFPGDIEAMEYAMKHKSVR
jgi:hypothetical protein